ncbi:5-keto-2-deoxygluconokinase [Labilithrix luteola]|uniref:5-keto-2-deoxygluconokinase n=1 Tax=Labilithrix luteola TaxID=1391654 RepID=A0A0K1PVN9_9BACT|nr:DUF2090 domain-containing protein [Labilithrix luteola]AKU97189.1 5-keto-2-deoxygluconokinase [Labilithrix luteola]
MVLGYTKPLCILPFDHRASYLSKMFGYAEPLTAEQHARVVDSKRVIYEGFVEALRAGVSPETSGILVDEEFGAAILRDAKASNYITAVSTERSGQKEFEFEYGDEFGSHLAAFHPTFAKALVRYNPDGDAALNERQTKRLVALSSYCSRARLPLMFELLVPATDAQLRKVDGDKDAYDLNLRPALMRAAIETLQDKGVEPAVWKVEGLLRREDGERLVETARRQGRSEVGCIVLGRGASEAKVEKWLRTAASIPGYIGFAVGRTTFWDSVADYEAKKISREEAANAIATRYREWVDVFESARVNPA